MKTESSAIRGVDFIQGGIEYFACRPRLNLKSEGHQYLAHGVDHEYRLSDKQSLLLDVGCMF
jgi:hypothetical protein